jgi:DNA ligase (NAD+)
MSEVAERINELRKKINFYNRKYYLEDTSLISDREFDLLLEELIDLETKHPEFFDANSPTQRVGGGITSKFETVRHEYPMLSLSNTYSSDELLEWDKRVAKG